MGDFIGKIQERRIDSKYSLVRKLGEGGFGAVYLGTSCRTGHIGLVRSSFTGKDFTTDEEVALKLEHKSLAPSVLEEEVEIYRTVQGLPGFPEVYSYDWQDDYKVMVFELLGPSLEDLFEYCGRRFSLKTIVMVMQQLLSRFEALHSKGLLHRDIKPSNCLLGVKEKGNVVYVTDFGLAQEYVVDDEAYPEIAGRRRRLVGTPRFASIRGHLGQGVYMSPCGSARINIIAVQSPSDDLESLGYMMIYFARGKLPWQGLKADGETDKHQRIVEMKTQLDVTELCTGLPQEFTEYMRYVKCLRNGQTPDYELLRDIFQRIAKTNGIDYDNIFDWTELFYLQQEAKVT